MKCLYFLALFLLTGQVLTGRQLQLQSLATSNETRDAESTVLSFLRKIYETQDDALKIAHQYIKLRRLPDSTTKSARDKRYEVAAAHITLWRQGGAIGSATSPLTKEEMATLRVVPYGSLVGNASNKLLEFPMPVEQSNNLYVVLKNNLPWNFFYVEKGKIYSFDYMKKGEYGPAYLFSY